METTSRIRSMRLHVNGAERLLKIEPRVSLLDALRDHLGLTGSKKGCNQGACGACTVLVDGERVNACLTLALQCEGREVMTIEGLADGDVLHPLQTAFITHDGFQCGYCTPGQICSALGMIGELERGWPSVVGQSVDGASAASISEPELQERMSGNLCRCGAYIGIREAIRDAAAGAMPGFGTGARTATATRPVAETGAVATGASTGAKATPATQAVAP